MFTTWESGVDKQLHDRMMKDFMHLSSNRDAEEMDKADVLVPHDFNLVDEAESAELVPELLLGHVLIKPANINVPARVALTDSQSDLCGDRRRLAPTDLELLAVQ